MSERCSLRFWCLCPCFPSSTSPIIKRDIFGHVCVCCRQILVAVRMTVNQTRQILGFVWVRNKFCVSLKSSRILPDAPTTELLVRGFWIFCFAFPFFFKPSCPRHWLHTVLVISSPQGEGSSRFLRALDAANNARGQGLSMTTALQCLSCSARSGFTRACAGHL